MAKRIDLFDTTCSHFTKQVLETIRKETFGEDMGQNSWNTILALVSVAEKSACSENQR